MFSQQHRLRKSSDIDQVWKSGRSFLTPIFSLKYKKNDLKVTRFAVIVGLKVSKRAVVRNKIKRRIREAIRVFIQDLKPGYDVIITARSAILKKEYRDISETINWAFKQIKLLPKTGK